MPLRPGLAATVSMIVSDDDTAMSVGSGDVPVLSTPNVVLLCERATVSAVTEQVDAGMTTVGHRVQLDHLAPTPVGGSVSADAVLESIEGRRLTFRVSVNDGHGLVAAGRITRVVVERERFMGRTTPD